MAEGHTPEAGVRDTGVPDTGPETQAGLVRRELLVGCAALVIAVGCLVAARGITAAVRTEGLPPSAWPSTVALGMIALAVTMLIRAALTARRAALPQPQPQIGGRILEADLRKRSENPSPNLVRGDLPETVAAGGRGRVAASLGAFVAYGVVWQWIDFRVCTVGLIAALAWIGGGRGWRPLLAFPIGLTALLWLLFGVLLEVPL